MTDLLVKKFVKDYENTSDPKVRERYGSLSSFTGIACNILLFAVKFAAGAVSGSVSIVSDAFNNLSDSASCIVTLIGYKLAAKPADKDHPFGHGRAEYLTSLIIAVSIMLVGFELLKSSAEKIMNPAQINFSIAALVTLIFSVAVKLWMAAFNTRLGNRINSSVMLATAKDSRSDVIATIAAVIGITASLFTDLPVDGAMGIIVSLFVLRAGLEIIKDTVDDLMGKPADRELVAKIEAAVTAPEIIIGVHDMVVHDYGPGRMFASCHAEVGSGEDFSEVHEVVDAVERIVYEQYGIIMTIHMDPVDVDNEQVTECREKVTGFLRSLDDSLRIHDFRMVIGESNINVLFDIVLPYECSLSESEIKEKTAAYLNDGSDTVYRLVVTFDREY